MNPEHVQIETALRRIATLEASQRRFRKWLALAIVAGLCLPLSAWVQEQRADPAQTRTQPEVRARKFTLVDAEGRPLGQLRVEPDGAPGLYLRSTNGKVMCKLRLVGEEESQLVLSDEKGKTRLALAVASNGEPHIVLSDQHQKPRVQVVVSARGAPGMLFVDGKGNMSAGIGIQAEGEPWLLPERDK